MSFQSGTPGGHEERRSGTPLLTTSFESRWSMQRQYPVGSKMPVKNRCDLNSSTDAPETYKSWLAKRRTSCYVGHLH